MTAVLYRLGQLCVRRSWVVLITWLLLVTALALVGRSVGSNVNDNLTLPGTDSQAAANVLTDKFPAQANGVTPVVLTAPAGSKITDQRFAQPIAQTVSRLQHDPDVRSAVSPLSSKGKSLQSGDQTIGYIAVTVRPGPSDLSTADAERIVGQADPARAAGLTVGFGSYVGQKVSKPATHSSEAIGLAMAIIVLLFTFGSVVAMGMPIITAVGGLVAGLSIITLLSHAVDVPSVAPTLATMIGLGVGIDYALFIVTRHLDQRRAGIGTRESIARSTATSGGAVLFAGCTVIVALLSLSLIRIPLVTMLGLTSAAMVAVAVLAAVTLLPAILAIIGDRIDSLHLPHRRERVRDDKPHGWARWATAVSAHPVVGATAALVVLVALALPTFTIYLGQKDSGALPTSTEARRAYDGMSTAFGAGSNGPLLVAVDLTATPAKADQKQLDKISDSKNSKEDQARKQATAKEQKIAASLEAKGVPADQAQAQAKSQVQPQLNQQLKKIDDQAAEQRKKADQSATDPRLQTLRTDLQKAGGVKQVSQPVVNSAGTAAVLTVTPTTAPSDPKTADLVTHLRSSTIPQAVHGTDMQVSVGGTTAAYVDLASQISDRLVPTIALVVVLSFFLLILAFRSIVVPLTAALMNLISIGAAFGVVTAVFEHGWGASAIGLDGPVPIVSYVPLMMFAVLFGLSMDYEVFLITHIREAWQRSGDNRSAVIAGVAGTGKVITSAALIMVSVFFAFVINGDPTVKQFGVGMGVAVAVDATIVRCLLVPAIMVLLGRLNWWFPRPMERLVPNFSIEGAEWFRARDAKDQTAAGAVPATPP